MSIYRPISPALSALDALFKLQQQRRQAMYSDDTRLSGTYGSDIDPFEDVQCEDYYLEDEDGLFHDWEFDDGSELDYDFENDEPLLWQDEIEDVTEDFPF